MDKRKLRQARFAQKPARGYGLVSRGEDFRLKRDPQARQQLYESVLAKIESKAAQDEISMQFRMLREALLGLKPTEFSKKVLLSSLRYAASVGDYKAYLPAISELVDTQTVSRAEKSEALIYLALHEAHISKRYEQAYRILFERVQDASGCVISLVDCFVQSNYAGWLDEYQRLDENCQGILRKTHIEVLQGLARRLESAFFQLQPDVIECLTHTPTHDLITSLHLGWKVVQPNQQVVLRERVVRGPKKVDADCAGETVFCFVTMDKPNTMSPMPVSSTSSDPVSIEDLEAGKLNMDDLIKEVRQLKTKISELRYEMCQYLQLMSSVDESTVPQQFFQDVTNQVNALKAASETYYNSYKRLLPIVRYAKLKNGVNPDEGVKVVRHEVAVDRRLLQDKNKRKPAPRRRRNSKKT